MDDGSEFKGAKYKNQKGFIQVLKDNGIERRLILGGNPQQNGMVERANGKLKMILAKNKQIKGGTWTSNLEKATDVHLITHTHTTTTTTTYAQHSSRINE